MDSEEFSGKREEVIEKIRTLIKKGNVNRIVIKNKSGKTIMNIPMTIVAAGALLAPALSAASFALALFTDCVVEVQKSSE